MVIFPNCKINLGLRILRKREDGFHDLETVFYPLPVKDVLEIIETPNTTSKIKETPRLTVQDSQFTNHNSTLPLFDTGTIQWHQSGLLIEGLPIDNLCIKAYNLIKKDFPALPPVQIFLHKNIPIGAGLGGGSADGSFALKLLNEKFLLGLSHDNMINYATQLGSDCAFFIKNKPILASGRGEIMEAFPLDLSSFSIALVSPGIYISTGWAFSTIIPSVPKIPLKEIIKNPVSLWKDRLINDFEIPVFAKYPEIKRIKDFLYAEGAIYASLSGSGSSVFGIFAKNQLPEIKKLREEYRTDRIL